MGNIGRPSTGCYLCRKRRVKCDEGRPGCRNCARLKKPCPGYREPGYGLIRNTVFVSHPGDVSRSPSGSVRSLPARTTQSESDDSDSAQSDSALVRPSARPSRPRPLDLSTDDLTEHAVCYSLVQLDLNSHRLYGNDTFSFLQTMLSQPNPRPYLLAAMRCVGLINFANRSPTVDMRALVESEFTRALSAVSLALSDPKECLKDETLVAVWLLGIRELLWGVTAKSPPSVKRLAMQQTHIDGTLMLLRLRGEEQFSRPEGRHLFTTLLSAMHWKPLLLGEEPSKEYLLLESQLSQATPSIPTASLKLRSFFHDVCKLRARIKNFLLVADERPIDRPRTVQSYLKAATRIDDKYREWCDNPSWLPHRLFLDPEKSHHGHSPWTSGTTFRRYWYESWVGFFHWNRYLVAKICLHASLVDVLSEFSASLSPLDNSGGRMVDEHTAYHVSLLHQAVRDFLGTLAYAFGDVDEFGYLRLTLTPATGDNPAAARRGINIPATLQVYAPMTYLVTLRHLTPGEREAMLLTLQRIRTEFSLPDLGPLT